MRYHDCPQRPCLISSRLSLVWCSALYVRMCVGCQLPGVRRPVWGRLMSMASVAPVWMSMYPSSLKFVFVVLLWICKECLDLAPNWPPRAP